MSDWKGLWKALRGDDSTPADPPNELEAIEMFLEAGSGLEEYGDATIIAGNDVMTLEFSDDVFTPETLMGDPSALARFQRRACGLVKFGQTRRGHDICVDTIPAEDGNHRTYLHRAGEVPFAVARNKTELLQWLHDGASSHVDIEDDDEWADDLFSVEQTFPRIADLNFAEALNSYRDGTPMPDSSGIMWDGNTDPGWQRSAIEHTLTLFFREREIADFEEHADLLPNFYMELRAELTDLARTMESQSLPTWVLRALDTDEKAFKSWAKQWEKAFNERKSLQQALLKRGKEEHDPEAVVDNEVSEILKTIQAGIGVMIERELIEVEPDNIKAVADHLLRAFGKAKTADSAVRKMTGALLSCGQVEEVYAEDLELRAALVEILGGGS